MKKIICILTVCMCVLNTPVSGASLGDMTKRVMDCFKIEITDDTSGINKLQNRRSIKNPALISAAINNCVIIARDGLVDEAGTDYTPLTNGLIKKYINDDNYRFVSGRQVDLVRNKNIVFNDDTMLITDTELNYTDIYTCVVNKDNVAIFVWKAADVKQPSLYKLKMYWIEGDELVVTEVYRKEYNLWLKESKNEFYSFDVSLINVNEEFIMKNLDKYIYVFADNYGGNIIIRGISD